jgi:hypothetical protein
MTLVNGGRVHHFAIVVDIMDYEKDADRRHTHHAAGQIAMKIFGR